ncbi:hypothetical protein B5F10_06975 [Anaerotruncus colihominis]|uniref:Uncharacterized protein n=1 Tax=Anaerotruncus colihominis TaxID=169435 RepID=A0A1Y4N1H0_9FIRM|nr:hypothetical protein B5F11_06100 [Anaerotruncus colihominis]OUP74744.1 hypothetical protein B5F10_06975 [Anaerotruncus colihominis]
MSFYGQFEEAFRKICVYSASCSFGPAAVILLWNRYRRRPHSDDSLLLVWAGSDKRRLLRDYAVFYLFYRARFPLLGLTRLYLMG